MKIGADVFIITNQGYRTISQLLTSYSIGRAYPKVLTYDPNASEPELYFEDISTIELYEDTPLYEVIFIENPTSRTIITSCSLDTQFLKYNVKPTTIEPIVNRSHNVYSYIIHNRESINMEWELLSNMTNYGVAMPFLCVSDTIVQYMEKKPKSQDNAYEIIGSTAEPIPIFTNKMIAQTNFILTF
jgi:hypothetical protein